VSGGLEKATWAWSWQPTIPLGWRGVSVEQPSDQVRARLAVLDEKLARLRELNALVSAGRPGAERPKADPVSESGLARLRSRIARTDSRRASRSQV
jgi:hypothetical protein